MIVLVEVFVECFQWLCVNEDVFVVVEGLVCDLGVVESEEVVYVVGVVVEVCLG